MMAQEISPRSKLPIQHPDYRYPGSKNPYAGKSQVFEGTLFMDNGTETHAGHWRDHFPESKLDPKAKGRELHVELGCNGGHVTLEWAARNPEARFIGVDWKFKQIYLGMEKAFKRGIKNLLFFRANLERLRYMFGEGEVDRLYLYFPDPWPKKSQWKNRSVNAASLRAWASIMKPGAGIFHIKTDHAGYFDWMLEALQSNLDVWEVIEQTRDLHSGNPQATALKIPEVTLFEGLFIKDGLPIHSLKLRRKA
jgi:tRNA (guanine-N7-)-methyltransferase